MDNVDFETRSRVMASVRSKNSRAELDVRRTLHAAGLRFRLHKKELPGSPDIVLPAIHTAIFVHGCFWHRHPGCRRATMPATNTSYWESKFQRNVERDARAARELEARGWAVCQVWECQASGPALRQLVEDLWALRAQTRAAAAGD